MARSARVWRCWLSSRRRRALGTKARGEWTTRGSWAVSAARWRRYQRGSGGASQGGEGGGAHVEEDEAEVAVAGEEIGGGESGGEVAVAPYPDEVGEGVVAEGGGVEGVEGIDEGDAAVGAAGGGEELAEEELAAATGGGANDLGKGAEGESAAGGVVDGVQAGCEGGGRRRGGGFAPSMSARETRREEAAEGGGIGGGGEQGEGAAPGAQNDE